MQAAPCVAVPRRHAGVATRRKRKSAGLRLIGSADKPPARCTSHAAKLARIAQASLATSSPGDAMVLGCRCSTRGRNMTRRPVTIAAAREARPRFLSADDRKCAQLRPQDRTHATAPGSGGHERQTAAHTRARREPTCAAPESRRRTAATHARAGSSVAKPIVLYADRALKGHRPLCSRRRAVCGTRGPDRPPALLPVVAGSEPCRAAGCPNAAQPELQPSAPPFLRPQ
jgi:hypothetical protein